MSKAIRPKYVIGTYGELLADFRENVTLSIEEMDEIIVNHGYTRERLEPFYNLLKIIKNYQIRNTLEGTKNPNGEEYN